MASAVVDTSRRVGWWLLLPALLIAVTPAIVHAARDATADPPTSLAAATLTGKRTVSGPVCIDQAQDVSGSMKRYAAQRDEAVAQLLSFATRELRGDDLLAEAVFAGTSEVTLPPTSLHTVGAARRPAAAIEDGSLLSPAVDALSATPHGSCAAKALVAVTDGQIFDDPAELGAKLKGARYSRVYLMIPGVHWTQSGDAISELPPNVTVRYFRGPDELGVAFGEVAAALTGERLSTRKKGAP
ncbi:VWA domain-containing protein [Virgisporangium aurantiacum]|uniref:VWA domain-containing protein n=1 Tax=Virgisporangium aurantiacum TaxID=175570 RepID=UPI0019504B31|nr:VWA domain-containing protein [Virgisporangium aurantiacum]